MRVRGLSIAIAFYALSLCMAFGEEMRAKSTIKVKGGGDMPGVTSLTGIQGEGKKATKSRSPQPYDIVKDLPDDAVFLKVGSSDVLKWGDVRRCVDAMVGIQLTGLFGAAAQGTDQMSEIKLGLYGSTLTNLLRAYLLTSLVAQEARREGLSISDEDVKKDIESFKKRTGKVFTFQYQLATNLVYQRAYIDKHIRPNVKVTDDEIAKLIKWRHDSNLSVPLTNAIFRAKIADLRKQIAEGKLEFADAAEKYSECSECCSDNGDCGPWGEDLDDLDPALKAYCFSAPIGVLSDVIDGTEAYHVVKVRNRYVPTKQAREEDGEVSSVEVKHLQIDKWLLDPEFTRETATKFITDKKIVFELSEVQDELMKKAKIESVLPLYDTRKKAPKTLIVK